MFSGFTKMIKKENGQPKPIATLTLEELANSNEQERIVTNAMRIHKMLLATYRATLFGFKEKYNLPDEFEFDRQTGEFFKKEKDNG